MNISQLATDINQTLTEQTTKFCQELNQIDEQLVSISDSLSGYLETGKRFRPLFALLGFLGTGEKLTPEIYRAASALEYLQASALIHDDLMDRSDTRRGKPALHKQFGQLHGEQFGQAAAILIGDLALIWSEEALQQSGLNSVQLSEVNIIYAKMRSELMAGQFLDVFEQTQHSFSVERALKIARYKSGKYSIERPLHYGAALSASKNRNSFYQIYSDYGLPLGEAFQLRDDLLGVYGDPTVTGKPAGDDLSEGKRTALIAYAYDRGDEATRNLIKEKLGKKLSLNEIEDFRGAIEATGAVFHIEDLIEKLSESALDAIESTELDLTARGLLVEMVSLVTKRSR